MKSNSEKDSTIKNDIEKAPKTGEWSFMRPELINEKCLGCGTCAQYCPEAAIEINEKDGKKMAEFDYDFCKGCGVCPTVCPMKAIIMKKKK